MRGAVAGAATAARVNSVHTAEANRISAEIPGAGIDPPQTFALSHRHQGGRIYRPNSPAQDRAEQQQRDDNDDRDGDDAKSPAQSNHRSAAGPEV